MGIVELLSDSHIFFYIFLKDSIKNVIFDNVFREVFELNNRFVFQSDYFLKFSFKWVYSLTNILILNKEAFLTFVFLMIL